MLPGPVLGLVPHRGNWVASTSHTDAKVDLCRGVSVSPGNIEFQDVELDVVWRWGEPAHIVDLGEFEALSLPGREVERYRAEAERVRAAADEAIEPFGPGFRQQLMDCTSPPDPRLAGTWAGGVGPQLVEAVTELLGPDVAANS